jgi:Transposase DDE domain
MLLHSSNAFNKISGLISASLQKLSKINKPRLKFMTTVFELWLSLPVRYTMLNLSRFGAYSDKSIRLHMEQRFDFVPFNTHLIEQQCGKELIAAFDPTFIAKSGKQTPGLGKWWSGTQQRALKGLEVGCLSIIDVQAATAMSLEAVQTPATAALQAQGNNLITHYVSIIEKRMDVLKATGVKYLVADGYFMKQAFMEPLVKKGLHVITKMRPDADLRYLYHGPKTKRSGRPRKYAGKVNCTAIDKRRLRKFEEDEQAVCYSGIVYSITLKRIVRIVYVQDKQSSGYEILVCTDTRLSAGQIIHYYRLRFQIEFLIRDAKQHCGLEQCQARSEQKLYFHFNMAFSVVSVAKAATWLSMPKDKRGAFSMRNIKLLYYNKMITDVIFSNLALDLSADKFKHLYQQCLNIGTLAA